jgi:hypothetical protein
MPEVLLAAAAAAAAAISLCRVNGFDGAAERPSALTARPSCNGYSREAVIHSSAWGALAVMTMIGGQA